MLIDNIKIGDRVEIQQNRQGERPKTHVSQVENKLDDNKVIIHVPISYGQLVELTNGVEYRFMFFTDKGLVRFEGMVEKHMEEEGFAVMLIKLAGEGERIQRRDFFRFSCILPLKFSMLDNVTMSEVDENEVYQGIIKDIGGGGVCFLTNESIEENSAIKLVIKLENDILIAIGEVIQKHYFPKSNYRYQYRVGFIGIHPTEQEKIVQFIFNEQKRMLQKVNRVR